MSKNDRIRLDPYAHIRRDNPPPDFPHRAKNIYTRKHRRNKIEIIREELEELESDNVNN
jgi:hypothetical protein